MSWYPYEQMNQKKTSKLFRFLNELHFIMMHKKKHYYFFN